MAMIIDLRRELSPSEIPCHEEIDAGGSAAEIILFPGVRYERWSDERGDGLSRTVKEPNAMAGAQTPRDWLDI